MRTRWPNEMILCVLLGTLGCETEVDLGDRDSGAELDSAVDGSLARDGDTDGSVGFETGADALGACRLREARRLFEQEWESDPRDAQAALGFALTEQLLLVESEAATSGLRLFGFDAEGLNTEEQIWGDGGSLDHLLRHAASDEYTDHVASIHPYPPIRLGGGDGRELIREGTQARELVEHVWALQSRFERLVAAYEAAAQNAPVSLTFGGHCGLARIDFAAPELFVMAAFNRFLVIIFQLTRAYDWDFPLRDLVDFRDATVERYSAIVDEFNSHLGRVADATPLAAVPELLRDWLRLLDLANERAVVAGAPTDRGSIDYREVPGALMTAIAENTDIGMRALDGPTRVTGLSPEVIFDARPVGTGELDLTSFGRAFVVREDATWGDVWIEIQEGPFDGLLLSLYSRSFLDESADFTWSQRNAFENDDAYWGLEDIASPTDPRRSARIIAAVRPVVERYLDVFYFRE